MKVIQELLGIELKLHPTNRNLQVLKIGDWRQRVTCKMKYFVTVVDLEKTKCTIVSKHSTMQLAHKAARKVDKENKALIVSTAGNELTFHTPTKRCTLKFPKQVDCVVDNRLW